MKRLSTTFLGLFCGVILLSSSAAQEEKTKQEGKKGDVAIPQSSVLDKTEIAPPELIAPQQQSQTPIVVPNTPNRVAPGSVSFLKAPNCCCDPRCNQKVAATLCVTDCDCCTHKVCVKIPCCCCSHLPTVKWRDGILGRKIAILCWEGCDYSVKVIVNRRGHVRVRYHFLID